jgi:hypothetical protein
MIMLINQVVLSKLRSITKRIYFDNNSNYNIIAFKNRICFFIDFNYFANHHYYKMVPY